MELQRASKDQNEGCTAQGDLLQIPTGQSHRALGSEAEGDCHGGRKPWGWGSSGGGTPVPWLHPLCILARWVCRLVSVSRNLDSPGLKMAGNCSWEAHPTNGNKASVMRRRSPWLSEEYMGGADRAEYPPPLPAFLPHPLAMDHMVCSWLPGSLDPVSLLVKQAWPP